MREACLVPSPSFVEWGVSTAQYSGHSFRIAAATTADKLGVPDSLIK